MAGKKPKLKRGGQPGARSASPFTDPTVKLTLRIPTTTNALLNAQCALTGQSPSVLLATVVHTLWGK